MNAWQRTLHIALVLAVATASGAISLAVLRVLYAIATGPAATELALFASTFALVFALGLQSQNVNGGHYAAAFFTSLAIGGANLVLYKLAPSASPSEMAAYITGGPLGIVASMAAHRRLFRRSP